MGRNTWSSKNRRRWLRGRDQVDHLFDPTRYELFGIDQQPAVDACLRLGRPGHYFADDFEEPSDLVLAQVAPADLVISSDVIEHLLDPRPLLAYLRSIVAADGTVVITTPEREALCGSEVRTPTNPSHVQEWARTEFERLLQSAGFDIVTWSILSPFSYRVDRLTIGWLVKRRLLRLPHRTNLVVFCRPS